MTKVTEATKVTEGLNGSMIFDLSYLRSLRYLSCIKQCFLKAVIVNLQTLYLAYSGYS